MGKESEINSVAQEKAGGAKPLRLKKTGDGLVIYSVGRDKIDNDGNINRERPSDPGTDLGFRLWDVSGRRQPPNPPIAEVEPLK